MTIACNSGDSEDPIPDQIQPATRQAEDPRSPSTGSGANGARHLEPALPTAPGPLTQPSAPPFLGLRSWEPLSAGSIITVAGAGPLGDGAPAKNARLSFPWGVAVDGAGNLFIADTPHHRIRRVDVVTGRISTVAGTGQRGFGGDGGPATQAQLDSPRGVAIDTDGNLLIADTRNQRIRLVQAGTGIITTAGVTADQVAGDGGGRFSEGVASAPSGLAVDNFGGLFVADPDRHRVIRLDQSTGDWTIMAGGGLDGVGKQGFEGDGGLAINALLSNPIGVAVDNAGNLFIADSRNHRIRRLDRSTGKITTVVGTGSPGFSGDGGQGVFAQLNGPSQVALDQDQNLLISDSLNNRIRQMNAKTGVIEIIAGSGNAGFDGDEGPATGASLNRPTGVAVDSSGNLFISDMFNRRIRRVDAGEAISTIAGVGSMGFGGDQGPATHTLVYQPAAVALDRAGNIFIADLGNQRIRRVDVDTGAITTVAGTGQEGFGGDGGPATEARLANPSGVAVDAAGNLYIADWDNHRIRRVDAVSGLISTVAGAGENGAGGDGGPATRAQLSSPRGVAVDDDGNFYIADTGSDRILRVDAATGIISTVAGSGKAGSVRGRRSCYRSSARRAHRRGGGSRGATFYRRFVQPPNPAGRPRDRNHLHGSRDS